MPSLRDKLQATLGDAYVLERELGGGGMSHVFVAEEVALGRKVVVKVLKPEFAAEVSTERFAREIRMAAQLQQANIVPLLSAGETAGVPYYTMPFVEGESLRAHLISGGALSIGATVNVLRDIARGLSYAHERGIVHRDVKPENVLLSGQAAVMTDFGIAKAIANSRTDAGATLTGTGMMLGTPAYIAPEQATGDPATDHRADIYAFGVLAYELLTGAPPFSGRSPSKLVAAHLTETPPSVDTQRAGVPPALADLVQRCLLKNPADRPQSAREILTTLDTASTPVEESAKPGIRGGAVAAASSRRTARRALIVASLVALAGLGAFGAWRQGWFSPGGWSSIAVLPFTNLSGDSTQQYFVAGMTDELTSALGKIPGLRVKSRTSMSAARPQSELEASEIGQRLGVSTVLEGSVRLDRGRLRVTARLIKTSDGFTLWSDSFEREMRDVFAVQSELATAIAGALRVKMSTADGATAGGLSDAGTLNLDAYDAYLRGAYALERRGAGVAQSVVFFEQAIAKDPQFARAYAALSHALELMPYFSDTPAPSVEARAIAAARRALEIDSTIAEARVGLALAYGHAYRWAEADSEYTRALRSDSASPIVRMQYGRHLVGLGRLPEAIEQLRKAVKLDSLSAVSRVWLAHAQSMAGLQDSALAEGDRARAIDPALLLVRTILPLDLIVSGRLAEARAFATGVEGPVPWRGQAAYLLATTGDRAGAETILRALQNHPKDTWMIHSALASAYLGLGDTTRTLDELERALAAREITPKWLSLSDRVYDPLRKHPRFAAVVRGFNLPESFVTPNGGRLAR